MSKVSSLDTDTKPRKETALQLALLALIVMVLGFVVIKQSRLKKSRNETCRCCKASESNPFFETNLGDT